ncbi:MAG: hypothetical protein O7A98_02280 [Acidobacteria bacterium]|nr:hypothetical protein [Acidobacteriota bacterium]
MSEPITPPPSPAQPAEKKGLGTVAWILIGCLGLLLLAGLGIGACTYLLGKKVQSVAEEFSENPGRAMAELAVKLNPELELVDSDDEAETVTVRNKETGEEMTFDWSEIGEGKFGVTTDEGTVSFDASGGDDGAVLTTTNAEGETTQIFGGAAAGDIPDWAPLAPGASEPQGTYSTRSGDEISGAFSYTTSSSTSDVLAFYDSTLSDEGYEVSKSTFSTGGEASGMVSGVNKSTGRSVSAMVGADEGTTQVTVSYSSGG